ncbi:MAG: hypothetical protein K6T17_04815 [Fimbriimonadales bacterium]|nr:hypothetical protein [Fimbriimonadales bacterium]
MASEIYLFKLGAALAVLAKAGLAPPVLSVCSGKVTNVALLLQIGDGFLIYG